MFKPGVSEGKNSFSRPDDDAVQLIRDRAANVGADQAVGCLVDGSPHERGPLWLDGTAVTSFGESM